MNSNIFIIISVVSVAAIVGIVLITTLTIRYKKRKALNNNVKKTSGVKE
jgi:hypothetical protein